MIRSEITIVRTASLLSTATTRWLSAKFFDHRGAQGVERIRGFVAFAAHIVAHKRKNEASPVGQFRKARARSNVLDRTGLRVNSPRGGRVVQAILRRPIRPGLRQAII